MKTKKQLMQKIKEGFKEIKILELKNNKKILKIMPKLTKKELQEIIKDNDISLYSLNNQDWIKEKEEDKS